MSSSAYRIELEHVSKRFPGVLALDDVSFKVKPGSVHVIVGENGAGKSTLMKVIDGLYKADKGTIRFNGAEVQIKDPIYARKLGIAMIFQELSYVPEMTIEENIFLGREPLFAKGAFIDKKEVTRLCREFIESEGLPYDPKTKIKELSVSDIQMIEILKAVSGGADLIIMDEPTSAISKTEVDILFKKIAELKARGISIVYISHRMEEIFRIADEITVMRDGRVVYCGAASSLTEETMIAHMVGRKMDNVYPKEALEIGDVRLAIKGYSGGKFKDVELTVRSGEIVGLAGLMGAGRTELARSVFGMDPHSAGELFVDGAAVKVKNTRDSIASGLVMVTEDRREYGLVQCRSIEENVAVSSLDKRMSARYFINKKAERGAVGEMAQMFRIKAPSMKVRAESLSGGNQQKVVLSKWFLTNPRIIIMDEPTRGIDVGAKFEIYAHMTALAKKGIAILMISSEMPELLGMCDRIYVMNSGRIAGELSREEASQESIMKLAIQA